MMHNHTITRDVQKTVLTQKVFKWWDYPVFILLTGLSMSAIAYFFSYWFSFKDWLYYPVSFSIMTFILVVILGNRLGQWFLLPYMRRPIPMTPRPSWKVGVATTFVAGEEPLEMLEKTVQGLIAMQYPHDTWVLDEEDDDEVKALCRRLGANHFSRKNFRHYQTENGTFQSASKHGNYNAWLYEVGFDRYDIVTAFDPDHVPERNFLSRVLGYFEDPRTGFVQVAQAYYNQKESFIARGAAENSYGYYSSVQMAAYGLGYPVIIGCHNTHRVVALKQVGGFAPHDADDVLITRFYRTSGWQGVYVPEILARGRAPVDWTGYLGQQRRWTRSALDLNFRCHPKVSGNLSFKTQLVSFLHGISHVHKSCTMFAGLILMVFMLASGITPRVVSYPTLPKLAIVYAVLQLCEIYRQRFYLDWQKESGLHWRAALLQLARWPYLLLALCDVISGRQVAYTVTPKVKRNSRDYVLFWPHFLLVTVIYAAWIIGISSGRMTEPLHMCAAIVVIGSLLLILINLRIHNPEGKRNS